MLELGSGFNPEFTGRENVHVNAAILGLDRSQTEDRLDGILAFADIGDFIDQPVKTYSSGMTMRLAFAVQTAVQPRILIVDEALGVGDMFFQAKCMARLKELTDRGVSLLFVSHDVGTVRQICQRALLIHEGRLEAIGPAASVADRYIKFQLEDRNRSAAAIVGNASSAFTAAAEPSPEPGAAATAGLTGALSTGVGIDTSGLEAVVHSAQDVEVQGDAERWELLQATASRPDVLQPCALYDDQFGADAFSLRSRHNRVGNGTATIRNVQMLREGVHSLTFDFDDEVIVRVHVSFESSLGNLNRSLMVRTLQGGRSVVVRLSAARRNGSKLPWRIHIRVRMTVQGSLDARRLCTRRRSRAAAGRHAYRLGIRRYGAVGI